MDFMLVELQHTPYIMCAYDILCIVVADFFTYIYNYTYVYVCISRDMFAVLIFMITGSTVFPMF